MFTDLSQKTCIKVQRGLSNLGALFASATNLALAVELYLKSLMILLRMDIPNTHELWTIFKRFPSELRSAIESQFDSSLDSVPGQTVALQLDIWAGGEPKAPLPDIPTDEKYDLKSLLKRCNNAFVTWRYIYERGEQGKHVLFEYEYVRLGVLCEVLRHIIQSRLTNQEASKRILRFKKNEEPYIYKQGDVSISCTRYIIENMSPALN